MDNTKQLGSAPVGKLLFQLAVPAIAAQVVNILYNIVDRIYIGHIPGIGATALTGVGVTFPVLMIISAFAALVGMGGAPLASIKMGENDMDGAERILGNSTVLLLIVSVVLTAVFLIFDKPILYTFGASDVTIGYAMDYMTIYVCGTVFVQIALGLNAFITAQGAAKTSMMTVLIGAIINIALDPVFIFGLNMGVRGAALATVIAQGVSALWVLLYLLGRRTRLRIAPRFLGLNWKIVSGIVALGISPFIMQSTESLLNVVFNTSLLKYGGDIAVGAMTILASLMQIMSMPIMGLTQGAQPIVSYNYGAKNYGRVKKAFQLLLISCLAYALIYWAMMMLFPNLFVSMFASDPALKTFTVWALRIYMAMIFVMGAQSACQQTFIALGQAKVSLFLALLRKIVLLIPLIYVIPLFFTGNEGKLFGVFLAEPVSDTLAVATTVTLFIIQFRKLLRKGEAEKKRASRLASSIDNGARSRL